jgi:hypothetical protein
MAATISINFASPEEVFSLEPPLRKSVSAKTLADVLGGGVVGGGYVRRTGDSMTGFLTLTSIMPTGTWDAVPKNYVDTHSFTRRYSYSTAGGTLSAGQTLVYGFDDNNNRLFFFDQTDQSRDVIEKYVDVYRNGILQVYNQDYAFLRVYQDQTGNLADIFPHTVQFFSPLVSGSNVQIHIGNVAAMPTVVGVATLTAWQGSGIRVKTVNGRDLSTTDLSISAFPLDFIASSSQLSDPRVSDRVPGVMTLSAYPLVPKAFGLFRKSPRQTSPSLPGYTRTLFTDKYGSTDGTFSRVKAFNIASLRSGISTDSPTTFTCSLSSGIFTDDSYSVLINVSVYSGDTSTDQYCNAVILNSTKTSTSFKFTVFDFFYGAPVGIDEISIMVF